MTAILYENVGAMWARGELAWDTDRVKAMLVTERYEPLQDQDFSRATVAPFEVESSGSYSRGGKPLGGREVERHEGGEIRLTSSSVSWTGFTGEFRYVVVYQDNGSREDDRLVGVYDIGSHKTVNAEVTVDWSADGVARFWVLPTEGN